MDTSSFPMMEVCSHWEGHFPCSHLVSQTALQPQDPNASVKNTAVGSAMPDSCKKDMLFQLRVKAIHHARSEQKSALNLMNRLESYTVCSSVNMQRIELRQKG